MTEKIGKVVDISTYRDYALVEATAEYIEMLASATEHINNAIQAKDEAVKTFETLNESFKRSEDILNIALLKAPEGARAAIKSTLSEQDKAIAAVNGFYAAKKQFEEAKRALEAAKKSGIAAAIKTAEENVKTAEALKDKLEVLKDAADSAKEEVKSLVEQAEKGIQQGMKQIDKANEKVEKIGDNMDCSLTQHYSPNLFDSKWIYKYVK